jgi:dual 3',5'-cyclic-AMP and -GMP phosphodiesterase 11
MSAAALERLLNHDFSSLRLLEIDAPGLFVAMLRRFDLFTTALPCDGAVAAVRTLVGEICCTYRPNPYHNWRHGFAVTHAVFSCLDRSAAAAAALDPTDKLAALVAALAHDVDHRGHTNAFEVNAMSELALRYNNQSVLEHHHAATLFRLMRRSSPDAAEHSFFDLRAAVAASVSVSPADNVLNLDRASLQQFRRVAIASILATDMAQHAGHVERLRGLSPEDVPRLPPEEVASLLMHAGDLSGQLCTDFASAFEWMERCNAEFHMQANLERANGLPSAPFMQVRTARVVIAVRHQNFRTRGGRGI